MQGTDEAAPNPAAADGREPPLRSGSRRWATNPLGAWAERKQKTESIIFILKLDVLL